MEVFRPSYREIDSKPSKVQNRNSKFGKDDNNNDFVGTAKGKSSSKISSNGKTESENSNDADTGSGFGANVQTFKRDIVHLKKLFPRKYINF